jgi:hypothetical protein
MTTSNPLHVGSGISRTVEPAARFQIGGFYPTFGMEFPLLAPLPILGPEYLKPVRELVQSLVVSNSFDRSQEFRVVFISIAGVFSVPT